MSYYSLTHSRGEPDREPTVETVSAGRVREMTDMTVTGVSRLPPVSFYRCVIVCHVCD